MCGSTARVGSRSSPRDVRASSASTAPLKKKRRLFHSDGTSLREPPLVRQQAQSKDVAPTPDPELHTRKAVAPTPDPKVGAKAIAPPLDLKAAMKKVVTGPSGSSGGGSVVAQVCSKKGPEATPEAAKVVMTVKEAAAAGKEVAIMMVAKEVMAAKATKEAMATKVAKEDMTAKGSDDAGGGTPTAAQADAEKALDVTPDLKVAAKRAATLTGSGGSSPPPKQFCGS
jgi:hypothetical protein